jgi:hypothetical protein
VAFHEHDRFGEGVAGAHDFHDLFRALRRDSKELYLAVDDQKESLGGVAPFEQCFPGLKLDDTGGLDKPVQGLRRQRREQEVLLQLGAYILAGL